MKVGVLVSHPIQYYSPWFQALARRVDLHVFYAHKPTAAQQGEGFGKAFEWDVDLLSGYKHSFIPNRSKDPGTHHFSGCDTPDIAAIIENGSFDVFVVFGWFLKSYWQAVRACRKRGIPVLVRGDSQLATDQSPVKRAVKRITHRNALRQFDGFLSVGQRNRAYLLHYGVPAAHIFFVPHFVDNDWFAKRAIEARPVRSQIRAQWSADDATLVLLFVGKFVPKKRPLDLLKATRILHEQNVRIRAVLVGSGGMEAELREYFQQHRLPLHFTGFKNQAELPGCYVSADALVLPSNGGETWGLVVNEGMACGLPAIVSDAVGCAPDLIDEGHTGFTFPLGDIEALAARIARAEELTKEGFDFGSHLESKLARYSVEAAVDGAMAAFARVMGHKV